MNNTNELSKLSKNETNLKRVIKVERVTRNKAKDKSKKRKSKDITKMVEQSERQQITWESFNKAKYPQAKEYSI